MNRKRPTKKEVVLFYMALLIHLDTVLGVNSFFIAPEEVRDFMNSFPECLQEYLDESEKLLQAYKQGIKDLAEKLIVEELD